MLAYPHSIRAPQSRRIELSKLLGGSAILTARGPANPIIRALCVDSRRASPGAVFFALPGERHDGLSFAAEAVSRGAVAVVASRQITLPPRVTVIEAADVHACLARAAQAFHAHPERTLELCGVTGTNGKTTVTTLLQYLLEEPDEPVGLLGTVAYRLGGRTLPASRTTPEASALYDFLGQIRDAGCRRAIMEVSSHAIEQKRVFGLPLRVAAFLNLTADHLDYHGDMEGYFRAKRALFDGTNGEIPQAAVINLDDPYGERLAGELNGITRVVTFGTGPEAIFRARDIELTEGGSRFTVVGPDGTTHIRMSLLGHYNVSNALAVIALAREFGVESAQITGKLAAFPGVPGRMESIAAGQRFQVLVDYAHTEDALRNALSMLRAIVRGRLLVVFGCGGNRQRDKRPAMTSVVQQYADHCWATADNPRREPLAAIFADMRAGVCDPARIAFVEDRRRAIHLALREAQPGDTVLIAGKGHEAFQEFADTIIPFDDRMVARELAQALLTSNALPPC